MTDLKKTAALHAKIYAFIADLDEPTLQSIASGAMHLTVVPANSTTAPAIYQPAPDVRIPHRMATDMPPSDNPLMVAHDLSMLESAQKRLTYLNSAQLTVAQLREVAKHRGLKRYSGLKRDSLIEELSGHGLADDPAHAPEKPAIPSIRPAEAPDIAGRVTLPQVSESPPVMTPPISTSKPDTDAATIAAHLRKIETEQAGSAYLRSQGVDRKELLAVAAELQLTRVERLSRADLERKVLKQAIGARRKFSGLRKW